MKDKNLYETFDRKGKLVLPKTTVSFSELAWHKHPTFEGVALKHLITSEQSEGKFSFHLVKIDPNKKIGLHVHDHQIETHEVISGHGVCINENVEITYEAGVVSVFQANCPHEVTANDEGLYMFAKFIPALL